LAFRFLVSTGPRVIEPK